MENTQQKINMALAAINYLTNTLDQVNIQMALIPSQGLMAKHLQEERVKHHKEFAYKLVELANEIGDILNESDATGEEEQAFLNPIFSFINQDYDHDDFEGQ